MDKETVRTAESEPLLGINEVVELTGITAFTIRYYDRCGFFPDLIRGKRGVRGFRAKDVAQLKLVDALRRSGLSIEGITYYVRLMKQGGPTLEDRISILQSQSTALEYQIAEAQESLAFLKETVERMQAVEATGPEERRSAPSD